MIGKSRVRAGGLLVFAGVMLCALRSAPGQVILGEAEKPFQPPSGFASKQHEAAEQDRRTRIEADRPYTLSELVDLAERYNPSTRAAWENTRAAAAQARHCSQRSAAGRERRLALNQHHSGRDAFQRRFRAADAGHLPANDSAELPYLHGTLELARRALLKLDNNYSVQTSPSTVRFWTSSSRPCAGTMNLLNAVELERWTAAQAKLRRNTRKPCERRSTPV